MSDQHHTPAILTRERTPTPIKQEAEQAPESVW